jgi:cobalt-precorrin-5B (C1)-methyltransferase
MPKPRSGYTLPVFACASAIAALQYLRPGSHQVEYVEVDLIAPAEVAKIAIAQVARLKDNAALAITHSDPGDNLDLTRHTPIWVLVEWQPENEQQEQIILVGGEGIGKHQESGKPAIYTYARQLLQANLGKLLAPTEKIVVTIVLPEGRSLAERTSNAAFGVVDGLSLLGTTGISQPLSAPEQLTAYRQELQEKTAYFDGLVFCIGENGLDFAAKLGIKLERLVKTANWVGSMLAEAGCQQVKSILLFGYHGKLIKLAGGIFHTHHHFADGRLEILVAHCANLGLPAGDLPAIFASPTTEAALKYLRGLDASTGSNWTERVYAAIAQTIDQRCQTYIYTHSQQHVKVGSVLFDGDRQIIVASPTGAALLAQLC